MPDDQLERIAHLIALEICEATAQQSDEWTWPDDFVGDVIDRATCRARQIDALLKEK